jgi:cobalamin-dependent methionine synthase I
MFDVVHQLFGSGHLQAPVRLKSAFYCKKAGNIILAQA